MPQLPWPPRATSLHQGSNLGQRIAAVAKAGSRRRGRHGPARLLLSAPAPAVAPALAPVPPPASAKVSAKVPAVAPTPSRHSLDGLQKVEADCAHADAQTQTDRQTRVSMGATPAVTPTLAPVPEPPSLMAVPAPTPVMNAQARAEARSGAVEVLCGGVSAWLRGADGVSDGNALRDAAEAWLSPERLKFWNFWSAGDLWALVIDALVKALAAGAVAAPKLTDLVQESGRSERKAPALLKALTGCLCPRCGERPPPRPTCSHCGGKCATTCRRCQGTGRYTQPCRACQNRGANAYGSARTCRRCGGTGKADLGECNGCRGTKTHPCGACERGRPLCETCEDAKRQNQRRAREATSGPPSKGVSISRCGAGELSDLQQLWTERGGRGTVLEAWSVDNPLLSWQYHRRKGAPGGVGP